MSLALTWSLIVAPSRTLERWRRRNASEELAASPLLLASACSVLPIAAHGFAAGFAPKRTVGSVVIALMAATLGCLGGVIVASRAAATATGPGAQPSAAELACVASLPMLIGATLAVAFERSAPAIALLISAASLVWARQAVLGSLRGAPAAGSIHAGRTALLVALGAHVPQLFRLALSPL